MNYHTHYSRLIERATGRDLTGYSERHHIVPRCMGGSECPDNLVRLTAREHFVAHQLLVKMHPEVRGLIFAANRMTHSAKGRSFGNRKYAWLRERHAIAMSAQMKNYYADPTAKVLAGDRQKARLSNDPEYAKRLIAASHTEASRVKASVSLRATLATPAGKAVMCRAAVEKASRPEQRALRSDLLRARHAKDDSMRIAARAGYTEASEIKRINSFRATLTSNEISAKFSKAAVKRWEDPVTREKATLAIRRGFADGSRSNVGARNPRAIGVVQLLPNGFIVNEFDTMKQAALMSGVDRNTISDRIKRKHLMWMEV